MKPVDWKGLNPSSSHPSPRSARNRSVIGLLHWTGSNGQMCEIMNAKTINKGTRQQIAQGAMSGFPLATDSRATALPRRGALDLLLQQGRTLTRLAKKSVSSFLAHERYALDCGPHVDTSLLHEQPSRPAARAARPRSRGALSLAAIISPSAREARDSSPDGGRGVAPWHPRPRPAPAEQSRATSAAKTALPGRVNGLSVCRGVFGRLRTVRFRVGAARWGRFWFSPRAREARWNSNGALIRLLARCATLCAPRSERPIVFIPIAPLHFFFLAGPIGLSRRSFALAATLAGRGGAVVATRCALPAG